MSIIQKIVRITLETMKEFSEITNKDLAKIMKCSDQSIRNWLTEKNTIMMASKHGIQEGLRTYYSGANQTEFQTALFSNLEKEQISLPSNYSKKSDFNSFLTYLFSNYPKEEKNMGIYSALGALRKNECLTEIIQKKFEINAARYGFFKIKEITENDLLLSFWNLDQAYDYSVLVIYYCNESDFLGDGSELGHTIDKMKKSRNVDMVLRFSFFSEAEGTIFACIKDNLYIDLMNLEQLQIPTVGKDFIYIGNDIDAEKVLMANKFADMILSHLSKYFTVIYKNTFFNQSSRYLHCYKKNKGKWWLLWEAKQAELEELDFEHEILDKSLASDKRELLVVLGFLGFPLISKLLHHFKRIVFLDNASQCIMAYRETVLKEYNSISCDMSFVQFTSTVAKYVTREYKLYGQADLVVCGVGNASLIRNLRGYCNYINQWLKPQGRVFLSCFNGNFFYEYQSQYELSQYMTYLPLGKENRALISKSQLQDNKNTPAYYVYCKLYEYKQFREIVGSYFTIKNIYSYPTLPFISRSYPGAVQSIFEYFDKSHSIEGVERNPNWANKGYYISTLAEKKLGDSIRFEHIEEEADNAQKFFNPLTISMKTLLLRKKGEDERKNASIYLVLLPENDRLPEKEELNIKLDGESFLLMNISEINQLGLEIGCISPFFTINHINITYCLYSEVKLDKYQYFLIESDNLNKKHILTKKSFLKYLTNYHFGGLAMGAEFLNQE